MGTGDNEADMADLVGVPMLRRGSVNDELLGTLREGPVWVRGLVVTLQVSLRFTFGFLDSRGLVGVIAHLELLPGGATLAGSSEGVVLLVSGGCSLAGAKWTFNLVLILFKSSYDTLLSSGKLKVVMLFYRKRKFDRCQILFIGK